MDEEIALGVMYTDFSKAFRTVSHNTLTDELMSQTATETAKADHAMAYQRMYRFEDKGWSAALQKEVWGVQLMVNSTGVNNVPWLPGGTTVS